VGADPDAAAAFDGSAFLFAHTTPYAGVLPGVESPTKALIDDRAAPADRLGLFHLKQRRTGCSNREEQFRVLVAAGGNVAPVRHDGNTPCFADLPDHFYASRGADRVLAVLRRSAAREQASSLVNTFTNRRDVKGAREKKYGR
jgi:hypothetical protein